MSRKFPEIGGADWNYARNKLIIKAQVGTAVYGVWAATKAQAERMVDNAMHLHWTAPCPKPYDPDRNERDLKALGLSDHPWGKEILLMLSCEASSALCYWCGSRDIWGYDESCCAHCKKCGMDGMGGWHDDRPDAPANQYDASPVAQFIS